MQGWRDWARYIMRGRDPTTAAVLAEDLGAVAGLGLACECGWRRHGGGREPWRGAHVVQLYQLRCFCTASTCAR